MPYYQSPDNQYHFLDSADFEYLLPQDSVKVSDNDAANPPLCIPRDNALLTLEGWREYFIYQSCGFPYGRLHAWPQAVQQAQGIQASVAGEDDALAQGKQVQWSWAQAVLAHEVHVQAMRAVADGLVATARAAMQAAQDEAQLQAAQDALREGVKSALSASGPFQVAPSLEEPPVQQSSTDGG